MESLNVKPSSGIALVATIIRFSDRKNDAAYWQAQSYLARLEALEQIRQEYHRWKYHAEPGFQRVYSILKRG